MKIDHELLGFQNNVCLKLFPEIVNIISISEIHDYGESGTYPFHECVFLQFVERSRNSSEILKRSAEYTESLMSSKHLGDVNLGQIALLEGFINYKIIEIIPYLGPKTKEFLEDSRERVNFDLQKWRG